jgi:hypothetical protein
MATEDDMADALMTDTASALGTRASTRSCLVTSEVRSESHDGIVTLS